MTDTDRILEYLQGHGSITSYEIRVKGLSGNPSQRVTELQDRGYDITAERFQRDGRPCVNYKLSPVSEQGRPGTSSPGAGVNGPRQVTDGSGALRGVPGPSLQDRTSVRTTRRASGADAGSVLTDDGGRDVEARPELALFTMPARADESTHMREAA